jgi:hypothetical protein
MSERPRSLTDEQLGVTIAALDVEWPPTPELAPAVMAAARAERPRVVRLPLSRPKRILLIAAATVLLLAGAAVAAKILVDLGAVVVEVAPGPPGVLPSPSRAPFGEPITVEEAVLLLGDDVPFPARLGPPARIWADEVLTEAGEVVRVTAAWRPGPGLPAIPGTRTGAVLMRFEGDADQAFKDVYEDTGIVEPSRFDGTEALWTSGTHLLELLTSQGVVLVRVEGNVLLWRDGSFTMRLETSLPKGAAVKVAVSIPPGTS